MTARAPHKRARVTGLLHAAHAVIRVLAIVVGLPLSVLSVISLTGLVTKSLPVHFGVGGFLVILLPAMTVTRLFPDRPKKDAASLSWDVLAVLWLVTATAFVGIAQPQTKTWMRAEATLLSAHGLPEVAQAIELVAAVRPDISAIEPRGPRASSSTPAASSSGTSDPAVPPTAVFLIPPPGSAIPATPSVPTSPERPELPLSLDEVLDRLVPTIVTVVVERPEGRASATGFFIDDRGTLATSKRLVSGALTVGVKRRDGSWIRGGRWVAGDDSAHALLQVEVDAPSPAMPFSSQASPELGTEVIGVANPLGLGRTRWVSRISGQGIDGLTVVDPIPSHRIGCPVVDRYGELVGMVTSRARKQAGPFDATPVLITSGAIRRSLERTDLEPHVLGPLLDKGAL